MSLLDLFVFLVVLGVCWWAVSALAGAFGLPAPIVTVVQVLLVVVGVCWLLQAVGWVSPGLLRLR